METLVELICDLFFFKWKYVLKNNIILKKSNWVFPKRHQLFPIFKVIDFSLMVLVKNFLKYLKRFIFLNIHTNTCLLFYLLKWTFIGVPKIDFSILLFSLKIISRNEVDKCFFTYFHWFWLWEFSSYILLSIDFVNKLLSYSSF